MMIKRMLKFAFSVLAILILWFILSMALSTPALPDPVTALSEFVAVFDKLCVHVAASLFRIFVSLVLSIILGVPLGLLIGRSKLLDYLLSPVMYMVYPIPKIALLPIVMLLLGLGDISKIVLIFIIVFFQIVVTCRDEAMRIRKEQFYFMESIGSSRIQIFKHLIVPHSFPAIFTSIRLSLGTSIAVLFFSENYGTDRGIGYLIIDSWMRVDYPEMFAGIIAISLMGIILFAMVDVIEKKVCPWK